MTRTARSIGLQLGRLQPGPLDAITDVAGVAVGHCTVSDPADASVCTGVTVVLPHGGNPFREKVVAAAHVINGFGKAVGLVQVAELGTLESPIALTNTLSVPAVADGLLDHALAANPEIGLRTGSVNVVVAECNDGYLNDLRGRHVRREHVAAALAAASTGRVEQGPVGAGRGMSLFELAGGIGSASRVATVGGQQQTVGVLVLANFGLVAELVVAGDPVGGRVRADAVPGAGGGALGLADGSIVTVLATDAPLSDRQLGRLLRRVQNGIARTGASTAHGSGEIAIGFTTAHRVAHRPRRRTAAYAQLHDELLDPLFEAVTESVEEAIVNALLNGRELCGRAGHRRHAFEVEWLRPLRGP